MSECDHWALDDYLHLCNLAGGNRRYKELDISSYSRQRRYWCLSYLCRRNLWAKGIQRVIRQPELSCCRLWNSLRPNIVKHCIYVYRIVGQRGWHRTSWDRIQCLNIRLRRDYNDGLLVWYFVSLELQPRHFRCSFHIQLADTVISVNSFAHNLSLSACGLLKCCMDIDPILWQRGHD